MERRNPKKPHVERMGPLMQKILLLLEGGLAFTFYGRPGSLARASKGIAKEWSAINRRALREAIGKLYQSQLVDCKEKSDGTIELVLTKEGKKRCLMYNLDSMKIDRPSRWDGLWRIVIFDIPEYKKKARDALAQKLRTLGFYPMQKSVFVCPFSCKDEVDFLTELFDIRPFVRFIIAKETDIDLRLKDIFSL